MFTIKQALKLYHHFHRICLVVIINVSCFYLNLLFIIDFLAGGETETDQYTLLDCIYHQHKCCFYILDVICWASQVFYECNVCVYLLIETFLLLLQSDARFTFLNTQCNGTGLLDLDVSKRNKHTKRNWVSFITFYICIYLFSV
jgi:hypothetical protein